MLPITRRHFLQSTAACGTALACPELFAQDAGQRPNQDPAVTVLNPKRRVPLSFIIDDSTCLVNLAHFGIPQFAQAYPDRYQQDWRSLPREIPDTFVRKFAQWCRDHGVKGKYSVVPYPACVGWIDRDLPGWSRRALDESLRLVRDDLMPDWDIHPEMISHTWVVDTKTGRPYPEQTERFMENFGWSQDKSVDELADYMSYALRILKNVGLPCEGLTTPGGFGSRNRVNLSQATLESCRDVFQAEIPHYFRDLYGSGDRSVAPRVENASGLDGDDPRCVVSIVGCTGDWFGGWDGLTPGNVDRMITQDLEGGRLPQVIQRGEPAILVCHWPGIYYNGDEVGFRIFQEAVTRVHQRFDHLQWMKLSEIARYWAARELTRIDVAQQRVVLNAPFATDDFTLEIKDATVSQVRMLKFAASEDRASGDRAAATDRGSASQEKTLTAVAGSQQLAGGTWYRHGDRGATVCFRLERGRTELHWS